MSRTVTRSLTGAKQSRWRRRRNPRTRPVPDSWSHAITMPASGCSRWLAVLLSAEKPRMRKVAFAQVTDGRPRERNQKSARGSGARLRVAQGEAGGRAP